MVHAALVAGCSQISWQVVFNVDHLSHIFHLTIYSLTVITRIVRCSSSVVLDIATNLLMLGS